MVENEYKSYTDRICIQESNNSFVLLSYSNALHYILLKIVKNLNMFVLTNFKALQVIVYKLRVPLRHANGNLDKTSRLLMFSKLEHHRNI